jgi:hypothetical protein
MGTSAYPNAANITQYTSGNRASISQSGGAGNSATIRQ